MTIGGLMKTTLLDYPGKVACTVFTRGCNFRCPFCHNASLVIPDRYYAEEISEADFFSFLDKRQGILDGVCVSGGEPTLNNDLPEFIEKIKNLGYKIGYHLYGDCVSTSYVSNLGKVYLPSQMYDFINNVDFVNAGENLYLTMVTLLDKMNIIFSSRLIDKSIIYKIIKTLQDSGLDVTIQTNYGGEK